MTTTVTMAQVEAEVRRLAAERPNFVYEKPEGQEMCRYQNIDGSPGCIFGQALANLGVPYTLEWEGGGINSVIKEVNPSETYSQWASKVQYAQDTHQPWGNAVALADAYIRDVYQPAFA